MQPISLTSKEAAVRLPGFIALLQRFRNPLVIILLLAACLSAFLGDMISFVTASQTTAWLW